MDSPSVAFAAKAPKMNNRNVRKGACASDRILVRLLYFSSFFFPGGPESDDAARTTSPTRDRVDERWDPRWLRGRRFNLAIDDADARTTTARAGGRRVVVDVAMGVVIATEDNADIITRVSVTSRSGGFPSRRGHTRK
jgi:hypothetical protein